jgi:hypothetical protein
MANTFKAIQTVTVGSGGAASIVFTSIPQTFTDLKLVVSAKTTVASTLDNILITFNSNTTGYSYQTLYGSGSLAYAAYSSGVAFSKWAGIANGATATSIFSSNEIYIPNYTSSNNKSYNVEAVSENNSTSSEQDLITGLWSNTAAITSITLTPDTGPNFAQYSTATLYGVSNVTAAGNAYATGGIITYDDTYVYHTFPWSGTFTPTRSLNVDYLVVAGGAGAVNGNNADAGGGGGAGGLRCTVGATGGGGSLESALSLTATAYTVTVGAGGTGGGGGTAATDGSNSVFSTITSTGGGRSIYRATGNTGGSGGGGSGGNNGGAGTANQGYAGGNSAATAGGGGGGANAVGATGSSTTGGAGGTGITTSISGTSTTYAGGGGGGGSTAGGAGGSGGGGAGTIYNGTPGAGTANTGGGGGGVGAAGGQSGNGGANGGSGIVIVRYAK